MGKTKRGKGSWYARADGLGHTFALSATRATPQEVTLVEPTLQASFLEEKPQRLIGDRAFDPDPLDERLKGGLL